MWSDTTFRRTLQKFKTSYANQKLYIRSAMQSTKRIAYTAWYDAGNSHSDTRAHMREYCMSTAGNWIYVLANCGVATNTLMTAAAVITCRCPTCQVQPRKSSKKMDSFPPCYSREQLTRRMIWHKKTNPTYQRKPAVVVKYLTYNLTDSGWRITFSKTNINAARPRMATPDGQFDGSLHCAESCRHCRLWQGFPEMARCHGARCLTCHRTRTPPEPAHRNENISKIIRNFSLMCR